MTREVHTMVTRHAVPEHRRYEEDPGIHPEIAPRQIHGAAWAIFCVLEAVDHEKLVVVSSPARRAIETAQALAETKDLQRFVTGDPIVSSDVGENAFDNLSEYDASLTWLAVMSRLVDSATEVTDDLKSTSLLVVTHEPVIRTMKPYLPRPNLDPLGVNEFRASVAES